MSKAIVIILDGVGVGNAPDAQEYGDEGSNTLGNLAQKLGALHLPNLEKFGLGNIISIQGVKPCAKPLASWGKMIERSKGKDSTSGHWELAGVIIEQEMPTYPKGFPDRIIEAFTEALEVKGVLGNKVSSGTVIIEELGKEHIETGFPIIYTSADSVFQIAVHTDVVPLKKLYQWCEIAREILTGKDAVARVIARPFSTDENGKFYRTVDRKDFSLKPFFPTILDITKSAALPVTGIGKIEDLYAFQGLTQSFHTHTNDEGIEKIIEILKEQKDGLVFANLVDTDQLYGHRNDCEGFHSSLMQFDKELPKILDAMGDQDILFLTADHGNDPTTPSTDHSREMVPVLVYGKNLKVVNLQTRNSFADIGRTISDFLEIPATRNGQSFFNLII